MSYTHRIQANRRELKYIISEAAAAKIREYVRSFLEPDEYADPNNNNSYEIHSLYLDSPTLTLANATIDGLKNRFKLRIRFYDFVEEHPVFFEIKRRVNDTILKERAAVHRPSVLRLLTGHWPERSDLVKADPKSMATLQRFCSLRDTIRGDGKAFVSYFREAYVSPNDDSVRVTFDRNLRASPYERSLNFVPVEDWLQPKIAGVVLELKFTDRYPGWMAELVKVFGLQRCAMPKYVHCVQSLGKRSVKVG